MDPRTTTVTSPVKRKILIIGIIKTIYAKYGLYVPCTLIWPFTFERLLPQRFSKYVTRRCTRIAGKNTRKSASRQILLLRTIRRCWQASNPRDCRGFSDSLIRVDARAASATGQRPLFLPLFPFSPDPAYIFMRRSPTAATTASGIAVVGLRYKKKNHSGNCCYGRRH